MRTRSWTYRPAPKGSVAVCDHCGAQVPYVLVLEGTKDARCITCWGKATRGLPFTG